MSDEIARRVQPDPVHNDKPFIGDMVMAQVADRMALGESRYGVKLQPHNGRDALQDCLEEALDLVFYLTQLKYERDHKA